MALPIKATPTLTGKEARNFERGHNRRTATAKVNWRFKSGDEVWIKGIVKCKAGELRSEYYLIAFMDNIHSFCVSGKNIKGGRKR